MSLATSTQLLSLIQRSFPALTVAATSSTQFAAAFSDGYRLYSNRIADDCRIPFALYFNSEEGANKYKSITGKTLDDVKTDLMYHFLTDFAEMDSFSFLRARIQDPASCGAIATAIGVSKYIKTHRSSPEEIKELLSGSKWRWRKLGGGDYIQQTLWGKYNDSFTELAVHNNEFFYNGNNLLSSIKKGTEWVATRLAAIAEVQRRTEQARRRQEEERSTSLQEYRTRATDVFSFKKGKDGRYSTFLGVELELEGHSQEEFKSLNTIKDHAIFKRDGSLDAGVEICTAPATLDVHKEEFKKFFDALPVNGSSLEAKSSCGMHVHIDRSKMSTLHVANLCMLLNNAANEQHLSRIAGRAPNSYCKTVAHSYYDFTTNNKGDRYRRVNLTPSSTVEIRMFASTTDYADFCKRMEFTQAVVDYSRPGATSISCKDIPDWDNFKQYVLKHRSFYPTLAKEM